MPFFLGAYCDRAFKTTIQLTNHVNTHLGIKPFQVGVAFSVSRCVENSIDSFLVQVLRILVHNERRTDSTRSIQVSRIRLVDVAHRRLFRHTLEKPHRCDECGYATVELSKLRRHIRTHTGVRIELVLSKNSFVDSCRLGKTLCLPSLFVLQSRYIQT